MKVTHIVPTAFSYFTDIRDRVFSWVEALNNLGVKVDIFTLQYDTPTAEVKEAVSAVAPTRVYEGARSIPAMTEMIVRTTLPKEVQIIHLHTPFLGGAGPIIDFIKSRPSARLVITHHRPVQFVDLLSVYIYFYNRYYLPRLFSLADAILLIEPKLATRREAQRYAGEIPILALESDKKNNKNYPHPLPSATVADNLVLMYNSLTED